MYLFLSFFAIILYLILKGKKSQEKAKLIYACTMTCVLCIVSSIRHVTSGIDTYQYYLWFDNIHNISWNSLFSDLIKLFKFDLSVEDPGFFLFTKITATIFNNFKLYNFIISLIFISAVSRIIYKSVHKLSGFVLSYCYYISLLYFNCPNNLMRQTLAMGLLLWSMIILIEKKNMAVTIILLLLAITIHKTALLGLIPLIMYYINNTRFIYLLGILIMPIIMNFGSVIVSFLALNSGSDRYLAYVDMEYGGRPIVYIIEMIIFYIIGFFSIKNIDKNNDYTRLSYVVFAVAIACVSFLWVSSDMVRITYYFSVWGIPFVANSIYYVKQPYLKKIFYIIILMLTIGRVSIEPMIYDFYWENIELHDRYIIL